MSDSVNTRGMVAAAAVYLVLAGSQLSLAASAEEKCIGAKNDIAGKLVACEAKALKTYYGTGDTGKYTTAIAKCRTKYTQSWNKAEEAAANAGTICPSENDAPLIRDFVDSCMSAVDDALSGEPLPTDVTTCNADVQSCGDDLETCQNDLATCVASSGQLLKSGQTKCYDPTDPDLYAVEVSCSGAGAGQDGQHQAGLSRSYTSNSNGTITDNRTGLMWEKLSDDGSIHDKDTRYNGLTDGIAKINTLNSTAFAGYTDWRLPNNVELASIADYGRTRPAVNPVFHTGCTASCTVLNCSCTASDVYMTSTTYQELPGAIFVFNFVDGDMFVSYQTEQRRVRAVRTIP